MLCQGKLQEGDKERGFMEPRSADEGVASGYMPGMQGLCKVPDSPSCNGPSL